MTSLTEEKKSLRSATARVRKVAHEQSGGDAPLLLATRGLPFVPHAEAKIVSGFYPYKSEIDVRPLLGKLAGEGWTTCLPEVIALGEPLRFRRWFPGEPTTPGLWDIPRPLDEAPFLEPDILLVPMMAFDRQGFRLGYGGGFYDRTLRELRAQKTIIAIGVAYAAQEVNAVPHDDNDARLDAVMTEKEWIGFGQRG
jgi:5-formyltetrahydrofolate cyclo-ligase